MSPTDGIVPEIPESGWKVHHQAAFNAWLATEPPVEWVTCVLEWIRGLPLLGPPVNARPVGDDRYMYDIPETGTTARYLVVAYEYLILIKDFL